MTRNLLLKILLIVVVLAGCGWFLYPPGDKIRLGKDLRGGVSLIYSVRFEEGERDREAIIEQMIRVLQDRVNPQGVLDISMQPLGNDRIEVVMPLPSPEVVELRNRYEQLLEGLLADAQISATQLDSELRYNRAPETFGADEQTERGRLILDLQDAYNTMTDARSRLREYRQQDNADSDEIARLEQEAAEAVIEYEDIRQQVLRLSLERSRLLRVLGLPTDRERMTDEDGRVLRDPETGEPLTMPSQREMELHRLKEEFPHLVDRLDNLVQAFDRYQQRRTGLDDPEDLKRLLRGAGVLEYRIAVRPGADDVNIEDLRRQLDERGPENVDSPVARWFEINELRQWYETPEQLEFLEANPAEYFEQARDLVAAARDGRYYLLLYHTPDKTMTHTDDRRWSVRGANRDVDQHGRPAVAFRLDATGGGLMSRLTGPHIGEPMAIVLDGEVYSAPTLQGQIATRGQITGNFSREEINYLIRVLAAGSLEARLSEEPIAENTLGPSIGADNLRRGMQAFMYATIAVAVFMTFYYFFAGIVAVFALLANALIIFGVMALLDGTFTLPGLAGIVLTIGMAVDANVLIYERIREEMFSGEYDLRGSIREGYNKALSTILDANITNLIVCFVLFQTATTEVKGFALTLTIGICATLFTCLFVTRVIYTLYTEVVRVRALPMLPTVIPAIHRLLEPNINWTGMRKAFWSVSIVAMAASIVLVSVRGVDLFDTELRGGVAVTMRTAEIEEPGARAERYWLPHVGADSVEQRVRAIADGVPDPMAADTEQERLRRAVLREFRTASVLTIGETRFDEQRGQVLGQSFQVKVPNPRGIDEDVMTSPIVVEAIVSEFGDELEATPPLRFRGSGEGHSEYTNPIEFDELGQNIGDTRYTAPVTDFLGGVVIHVRDVEPAVTVEEARQRIARMRSQPDFSEIGGRQTQVFGLEAADPDRPDGRYRDIAIVVYDPEYSYMRVGFDTWDQHMAQREWELVNEALARPASLEQVASYSAAMARTLAAQAQAAVILALLGILVYIWVRFGSLRYSMAAIAALMHDVIIALGLLALTAYVGRTFLGGMLLVEEFRIDLGVVAALLTIIGYSLNDTIVILDRIRENRGKLPVPTAPIVNRSINQTISRTVLTTTTTLMAVVIMYIAGGSGIRPFAFTLMMGILIGTYSSVAIAAPLVFSHHQPRRAATAEPDEPGEGERPVLEPEGGEPRPA